MFNEACDCKSRFYYYRQLEELARTLKEEDQIGHVMELSNSIFTPSAPELAIEVSSSEGTTETELVMLHLIYF